MRIRDVRLWYAAQRNLLDRLEDEGGIAVAVDHVYLVGNARGAVATIVHCFVVGSS